MADVEEKAKSKRENYISRMKERMPDVDFDSEDPDVRYGAYEQYDDDTQKELGGYRENDGKMREAFKRDPRSASFMSDVVGGGDTTGSFAKHFGKDMLEMSGDEETMAKLNEANQEYLNRIADSDRMRQEQESNMEASAQDMSAFKEEKGMDDAAFEAFIGKCYEVIENALMGKIDKSFLEVMHKGLNYEGDLADAANAGVVEGRNQKIDETIKRTKGDGVPTLNSGGKGGQKKAANPQKRSFYD